MEIDLNQEPGGENRELEGPSTQVEPQQVQASQQRQAVQMPQPAQPATIDVEAIVDDDVVESSPRAFAEAKNNARNNARRNRERTIVDVDLEDQNRITNYCRNKRRRESSSRTVINCDLYINLESSSSSMITPAW